MATPEGEPPFLPVLREIASLAGSGLGFSREPFEIERYERIAVLVQGLIADGIGAPVHEVGIALENKAGYVTPKVDVRGGVVQNGRILLVREKSDGKWALPGGYADVNLSPAAATEAEIEQESGYTAKAIKLVALLDRRRHHQSHPLLLHCYKIFFLCELTGGTQRPSQETSDAQFFSPDALPELSLGRSNEAQIRLILEHDKNRDLPTVFE